MTTVNEAVNQTIVADDVHQGIRADVFLCGQLSGHSRSQITNWFKSGLIQSTIKKPSQILRGGEVFIVTPPTPAPGFMEKENIPLDILFEDEHLAIVNKPKGMVVHPGAGVKNGTLCNALLHHFPDMVVGDVERPGLVHRLDKDTSGIMVIAKNNQALNALSEAFKAREVKKVYRAFCFGKLPLKVWDVQSGHRRHPLNRLKFTTNVDIPKDEQDKDTRFAHSTFYELGHAQGLSSVEIVLHTGRTHQIRAHLADRGLPIVGDELYGGKRLFQKDFPAEQKEASEQLVGQALHAYALEFKHPITNAPLSFSAPLPSYFQVMAKLF